MSSQQGRLERALSIGLTGAAVVMAAAVVYREFAPAEGRETGSIVTARPVFSGDWQDILRNARFLGDTVAPVTLIEFADLECPGCRQFHEEILPTLRKRFGAQLRTSFVHLPLRMHRFAKPAARAAECAAEQGRFSEFVEQTFLKQDSLGLKMWSSLAKEAGVRDTIVFAKCLARSQPTALVDSGLAVAKRLGINATPTVIVNGWRIQSPSDEVLTRVITELIAGRNPFPAESAAR